MSALTTAFEQACARAAVACQPWIGQRNKGAADAAAVAAMRAAFATVPMIGRIVIGEGERDEAPMLFIGEQVGEGRGEAVDIAVDPLEGTTLCAENRPGALCVAAFAPRGELLHAPDVYMQKLVAGPGLRLLPDDLDRPAEDVLARLAAEVEGPLRVVMLDRPRHRPMMEAARAVGAALSLIADGDVMGALQTALTDSATGLPPYHVYMGSGGAPEGVLAASGLKALGGSMLGRLLFRDEAERARARNLGLHDLERVYTLSDLASPAAHLVLAGVTADVLDGVQGGRVHVLTLSPDQPPRRQFLTL
ncbi:MAG: fructose-bisphosphatase class II [Alphaproteobacteria bacterium TMED89]|nr:fructose-bisphosphatase class II [Rhodospirillaceae bacterium]RPH15917.1 MAG: fructose-bisphosphatase class II [Alphaproteobacteria bacterium TMED89]